MKLDVVGVVVGDMGASLAFYRSLGLEFPEGAETEGHVETTLPGGLRLAFDNRGGHAQLRRKLVTSLGQPAHEPRLRVPDAG